MGIEDMAREWKAIAREALRIGYFQVPKHEDDPEVVILDRRIARYHHDHGQPFSFTNAPAGVNAGDYLLEH
jgi:hypothetical protein